MKLDSVWIEHFLSNLRQWHLELCTLSMLRKYYLLRSCQDRDRANESRRAHHVTITQGANSFRVPHRLANKSIKPFGLLKAKIFSISRECTSSGETQIELPSLSQQGTERDTLRCTTGRHLTSQFVCCVDDVIRPTVDWCFFIPKYCFVRYGKILVTEPKEEYMDVQVIRVFASKY